MSRPDAPGERGDDLSGRVVPLPTEPHAAPGAHHTSRPGRVHGLAMAGMSLCALVGIIATLAFITVAWPGQWGRRVIAVVVVCAFGFMACAAAAILSAARDTYPRRGAAAGDGRGRD